MALLLPWQASVFGSLLHSPDGRRLEAAGHRTFGCLLAIVRQDAGGLV